MSDVYQEITLDRFLNRFLFSYEKSDSFSVDVVVIYIICTQMIFKLTVHKLIQILYEL